MIDPLVPLLVVPDVNDNIPLTPVVPAFTVCNTIAPLDVCVPSPVLNDIAPPVNGSLSPATPRISPPLSVFDLPTDNNRKFKGQNNRGVRLQNTSGGWAMSYGFLGSIEL